MTKQKVYIFALNLIFVIFPLNLNAQNHWFGFSVGQNTLQSKPSVPYNIHNYTDYFPDGNWPAIDEKKMQDGIAQINQWRRNISYNLSWTYRFNESSLVQTDLGYAMTKYTSTTGSRLRFSDQIEQTASFVNPSYYMLKDAIIYNKYIFIRSKVLVERRAWGRIHRLGSGLMFYHVLNSDYLLQLHHSKNNTEHFYSNQDLKFKDHVMQVILEMHYQISIIESKKANIFAYVAFNNGAYHFKPNVLPFWKFNSMFNSNRRQAMFSFALNTELN